MTKTQHEQVMEAIMRYLKNHGLQFGCEIDFPMYKIHPPEVDLALEVLKRNGMTINVGLSPSK